MAFSLLVGKTGPSVGPHVRIWLRRELRLDRLTITQQTMAAIGFGALRELKQRVSKGIGPNDQASKPLSKSWSKIKVKRGLKPIRDLRGTGLFTAKSAAAAGLAAPKKGGLKNVGHLLDNLTVRTVSANQARIGTSTRAARAKSWWNYKIEPWLQLSPRNYRRVKQLADIYVHAAAQRMVKVVSFRRAA